MSKEKHPAKLRNPLRNRITGSGIERVENLHTIVYEPFSGSGTTLIACEQLGRRCRAVEISPAYVAVALERWSQATGKTPTLLTE